MKALSFHLILAILVPLLQTGAANKLANGAATLFIGNSFFIPIARKFDELAVGNGFSSHTFERFFRGGLKGTPASLYNNEENRLEITTMLAAGNIDIFGMTVGPAQQDNATAIEDYVNWFDLALGYNPDTTFFIGVPWPPGSPSLGSAGIEEFSQAVKPKVNQILSELRPLYPNNQIFLIMYDKAASWMRAQFDNGSLPGINAVIGDRETSIHRDELGHAGTMLIEAAALSWLEILYGADIGTLDYGERNMTTMISLTQNVVEYNADFRVTSHGTTEDIESNKEAISRDSTPMDDMESSEEATSGVFLVRLRNHLISLTLGWLLAASLTGPRRF